MKIDIKSNKGFLLGGKKVPHSQGIEAYSASDRWNDNENDKNLQLHDEHMFGPMVVCSLYKEEKKKG